MSGGRGSSQSSTRIEQLAPELEKIISPSEPIQHLADGFGGAPGPAEGPLWWKEGGYLLFSDIHNNRRMKYEPGKGVSRVPGADQPGQWADPRPAGPARRLRARLAGASPGRNSTAASR